MEEQNSLIGVQRKIRSVTHRMRENVFKAEDELTRLETIVSQSIQMLEKIDQQLKQEGATEAASSVEEVTSTLSAWKRHVAEFGDEDSPGTYRTFRNDLRDLEAGLAILTSLVGAN